MVLLLYDALGSIKCKIYVPRAVILLRLIGSISFKIAEKNESLVLVFWGLGVLWGMSQMMMPATRKLWKFLATDLLELR